MKTPLALALLTALAAAPFVHAQAPSDSDYNTTAPSDNSSYANDSATPASPTDATPGQDPAVNDSDMDTSVPPEDTSYLNDTGTPSDATAATPADDGSGAAATTPASGATPPSAPAGTTPAAKAPGFELVALAGAAGAAALVLRRGQR